MGPESNMGRFVCLMHHFIRPFIAQQRKQGARWIISSTQITQLVCCCSVCSTGERWRRVLLRDVLVFKWVCGVFSLGCFSPKRCHFVLFAAPSVDTVSRNEQMYSRETSIEEAASDILEQSASLHMSASTTSQRREEVKQSNKNLPLYLCVRACVCMQWSIKTVSSLVSVAFQQHYPGQREFVFSWHTHFSRHSHPVFCNKLERCSPDSHLPPTLNSENNTAEITVTVRLLHNYCDLTKTPQIGVSNMQQPNTSSMMTLHCSASWKTVCSLQSKANMTSYSTLPSSP